MIANGEAMGKQMRDGDLNRRRDAKLLVDAMRACDDASRFEFLLRLQLSYRQWPHPPWPAKKYLMRLTSRQPRTR